MNVRNLYIYHCSNDLLKILKFRTPMSIFELFELSNRTGKETRLIPCNPSNNFLYTGSLIWNVVRELIKIYDFSIKVGPTKTAVKKEILKTQGDGDPVEWQHDSWNAINYHMYKG